MSLTGGKRKLSKWNKFVQKVYADQHRKNKNFQFKDALKMASEMKKKGQYGGKEEIADVNMTDSDIDVDMDNISDEVDVDVDAGMDNMSDAVDVDMDNMAGGRRRRRTMHRRRGRTMRGRRKTMRRSRSQRRSQRRSRGLRGGVVVF